MILALTATLIVAYAAHAERALPCILIPGTGGSTLKFADGPATGQLYWLDERILDRDRLLLGRLDSDPSAGPAMVAGDVLDAVSSHGIETLRARVRRWAEARSPGSGRLTAGLPIGWPIYESFLRWAREELGEDGFHVAPYDWRLRPQAALAELDRVVERARDRSGASRVILVGHSLGGLLAREYVATIGRGKVRALIAVGTPWEGTTQAARALIVGHDFGLGLDAPDRLPRIGRIPKIRAVVDDSATARRRVVRCQARFSFVRGEDTRALTVTFPSAFLMIPTRRYGAQLAALLGSGAPDGVSPVAEWSWREFEEHVSLANRPLADWAARWRERFLDGDSFGVQHILVAFVCAPGTPAEDCSTVRFSVRPPRGATSRDELAIQIYRRAASEMTGHSAWPVGLNLFIPIECGPDLGDGTVPLFSATCGALRRVDQRPDFAAASSLLGPEVTVVAGTLPPGLTHMTALDAPQVRAAIVAACRGTGRLTLPADVRRERDPR